MPTTRETVLAALQARLQPLAALTLRDEVLPERIPTAGLIILRDGQPGEPEVTLSPLRYHYQHRAELEVVVQAGTGRASTFDTLIASIGTKLEADRTLGGLCDWIEPEVTLSPLRYHYQHRVELEVVVQAPNGRATAFDSLIADIGTALEADRTLGGLCDWVEPEAPASVDLPIEGAASLKAAIITVVLHYTTTGPLA